jgi:hypothetical protein
MARSSCTTSTAGLVQRPSEPSCRVCRVGIGRLVIEFERSRLRLAKNIDEIDVATDIKVAASVLNFVNDGGLKVSTFRVFEASPQPHRLHGRKRDSRFKNWDVRSLGLFAHIKERDFFAYSYPHVTLTLVARRLPLLLTFNE